MGGIRLTRKEKASGLKEIGGTVQPFMTWHDPETGQEFPRLPADAPNACNYMIRGFKMGPAPEKLSKKWEAGKAKRVAAYDKRLKERLTRPGLTAVEQARVKRLEDGAEAAPAQSTAEVAAEVIKQMMELGVIKAPDAPAEKAAEETEAGPEGGDVQLKLL